MVTRSRRSQISTAWFLQGRIEAMNGYLADGTIRISQQPTERLGLTFTLDHLPDSDTPADARNRSVGSPPA